MASEYLKWKFKDIKPEEKAELTPAEKRKNWWFYHKWHLLAAVVLLTIAGNIIWNALTREEPDYKIAYVGEHALPDDTVAALEAGFAALGEDLNGDGKTVAALVQYVSSAEDAGAATATEVSLMGDILECESFFFLLDDPAKFQKSYHTLSLTDGSLPPESDLSAEGTYFVWEQCPILADMELGDYSYSLMGETVSGHNQDIVSKLYFARRGFWTEKSTAYPEGCAALWNKLTEGAVS